MRKKSCQILRPEFKGSVGNDVITAVVGIMIEATFDGLLDVPVFYKKGTDGNGKPEPKYQTKEGNVPTALKLEFADPELLVDKGNIGIDEYELKAIRFLSGLSGDQSKVISGAVFRLFGDLEIGFVVGGHFSVGDNETLAKVIDTVFETASKRIVEYGGYKGFKKLTLDYSRITGLSPDKQSPGSQLLVELKEIEETEISFRTHENQMFQNW